MDSLSQIPGIGPQTITKLTKLKIQKPSDLLYHFPHRYIDFSHITNINKTIENENATITGKLISFQNIFTRSHKNLQKAVVADNTGQINLLWFNQPYLSKNFKIGDTYSFAGTISLFQNKKTIISPVYGQYHTGKIIAIYPETSGLSSTWFRKTIQTHLPNLLLNIIETLPQNIINNYKLLNLKKSLSEIHNPQNLNILTQARNRLAVEEILKLQIHSYLSKKDWLTKTPKIKLTLSPTIDKKIKKLITHLPYELTLSQKQILLEIISDLTNPKKVTNRLIQGEVGSGKTILALIACFLTHLNNSLSLFIAPTEILTNQHFITFQKILKPFKVPILLLTGSKKINLKKIPKDAIIIATHAAIFQKDILENKVALVIIDEQHKFGVKQRSFLSSSIHPPHCLTMTATPIPRTISLTMLGNLDISTITSLPKKRLPIKTFLVPNNKIPNCYNWIQNQIIKTKCQAFIVCPFIEESESMQSVKSAIKEFEYLSKTIFPNLKLALIHGKIKPKEKEKIITKFKKNQINILITTPIIEVGIDIPNASIMIIQSADRFGLASLHQIRGRIGRGHLQSYCYLFTESNNEKSTSRLQFLTNNNNGLKIAEYDLKTRGPGEAFSIIQHGFPSLKIANFSDLELINLGQKILTELINTPNFDLSIITSENLPAESIINN
ncbi:MAG: ATP-dependent DNA helicase RecG [Candidatus Shapirobacteria bacterium]|nr:ATP-dependent DNA helicase RecG [Candidatus Shapirobacteria bacterium]